MTKDEWARLERIPAMRNDLMAAPNPVAMEDWQATAQRYSGVIMELKSELALAQADNVRLRALLAQSRTQS